MNLFSALQLDPRSRMPLHRQLYAELRVAVLTGRLKGGTRLSSTRALANDLGVSRNTVIDAYEQLIVEGYFETVSGVGTFVRGNLAETSPKVTANGAKVPARSTVRKRVASLPPPAADFRLPLCPGIPAVEQFPISVWAHLSSKWAAKASRTLLNYPDPLGYGSLREAVAEYLAAARGVRCDANQVVIVGGAQQGMDIAARLLCDSEGSVWVEDPGYLATRNLIATLGASIIPVRVDGEGLDVEDGIRRSHNPQLICISPSHQFPLGTTMSLDRRLRLLEWIQSSGAFILEDDYDSEFQYGGRAVTALQGLDQAGRVLYVGTFSKVLFPGLRLGYVVVPRDLVTEFGRLKSIVDFGSNATTQAIVADFMSAGYFSRHVRRMRHLYRERQAHLIQCATELLGNRLRVQPADIGLHVMAWLPDRADDRKIAQRLRAEGFGCPAVSSYCQRQRLKPALVLGYGNLDKSQIEACVERLARALP